MTIREMHYDFKSKLNKIDSQQNRNLLVPEIDWKLNEAMGIYVRAIIQPKYKKEIENKIGYEINQRSIDDVRGETVDLIKTDSIALTPYATYKDKSFIGTLPSDYMFYLQQGNIVANKIVNDEVVCTELLRCFLKQADTLHYDSSFDNSSFEWRECNIEFRNQTIVVYTDGTFTPTLASIRYFTKLPFINNAQDFTQGGGQYYKPDGITLLSGSTNCPLPSYVHSEIVDLAVAITKGDLQMPGYNVALNKMNITQ